MEILTGFYLVSSVVQNIAFFLPAWVPSRKIYFDKLMLIVNLTHIHMYLSLKKFIVVSMIICPVNNNAYINFFLIFFSRQILGF